MKEDVDCNNSLKEQIVQQDYDDGDCDGDARSTRTGSGLLGGVHVEEEDVHIPFEWLTNFASLARYLNPGSLFPTTQQDADDDKILDQNEDDEVHVPTISNQPHNQGLKVLHVGCGSSKLGEMLQRRFPRYNYVLNVDNDVETLVGMKKRWNLRLQKWKEMNLIADENHELMVQLKYAVMDFQRNEDTCTNSLELEQHPDLDPFQEDPNNKPKFDLILDKSTLDCLLCSDDGAIGLLCKIYEHLKHNGVYFLISFHHVDFILPLLEGCPGVDWTVSRYVVPREVDSPAVVKRYEAMVDKAGLVPFELGIECKDDQYELNDSREEVVESPDIVPPSSAWASGEFHPDQEYDRTVNVFICRRRGDGDHAGLDQMLDYEEVRKHIHLSNDNYFKKHNPMVTHVRMDELKHRFLSEFKKITKESKASASTTLPIRSCYEILFTDAEKEHLTYEFFMEDWIVYCSGRHENGDPVSEDGMTFETAVDFLEMMQ
jgi:SAM-dependent methyltransferase